jgi:hypothetical protein
MATAAVLPAATGAVRIIIIFRGSFICATLVAGIQCSHSPILYISFQNPSSSTSEEKMVEIDLYQELKSLERQTEFVSLQEEYLKDEMRHLQRELLRAKEEIRRIQSVPLVIGQFNEMIDANYGIVSSTAGSNYFVRILSTLDREQLKPNTSVALHRHSHSVVDILPSETDSSVKLMQEKPNVTYKVCLNSWHCCWLLYGKRLTCSLFSFAGHWWHGYAETRSSRSH